MKIEANVGFASNGVNGPVYDTHYSAYRIIF